MAERRGKQAEDAAADYLISLGYTIVTRRYKVRLGELDVVALDGDTLVIVEVKERRAPDWIPEEGVDDRKIASLSAAVEQYLLQMGEPERVVRYDLIAIDRDGLRHHIDAFRP
jgi:putative endonuclease